MSIAVLNQVYDEVRRLAIAGSNLAAGDFRLKKLVEPLQKSAQKAPVFGKVAESIEKVLASNPQNSAETLLELTTLTTAILYTQGETGAEGKLETIKSQDLGLTVSNTSARVLKPLIEALTTIGSGRMEIIKEANERGAFKDLRLIKHAIAAIDDKYSEIGDYVADDILPMYGKAIYPEIQEQYDVKGKGDDARRLRLMHRLDRDATRPLVDAALSDGSTDVKLEAINCIKGRADCVPFLLDQAKAKNKEVRESALQSLGPIDEPSVIEVLQKALSGADVGLVAPHISENPSSSLRQFVVEEATRQRAALLAARTSDSKKAAAAAAAATPATPAPKTKSKKAAAPAVLDEKELGQRFHNLLSAFNGRTDKDAVKFLLDCFELQAEILKVKAGYVDGEDINQRIAEMMLMSGSKETLSKLIERGVNTTPELIVYGFVASSLHHGAAKTYETFHAAYLNRPTGKTKNAVAAREFAERLSGVLTEAHRYRKYIEKQQIHYYYSGFAKLYAKVDLDPRWLDAALSCKDESVILELINGRHEGVWKYLTEQVDAELKKKTWNPSHTLDDMIEAMIVSEHPELVPKYLAVLARSNSTANQWWNYYLYRLMARMPQAAIEPLEAMLPTINEKTVDLFVGSLDELKQRFKT